MSEVHSPRVEQLAQSWGETACSPSLEEVCHRFVIPAVENGIGQVSVFGMSEPRDYALISEIETMKLDFQGREEECLSVVKIWVVRAYYSTPFIRHLRQRIRAAIPSGQFDGNASEDWVARVGGRNGCDNRAG